MTEQLEETERLRKVLNEDAKEVAERFNAGQQELAEKEERLSSFKAPYDKFKKLVEKLMSQEMAVQNQFEEIEKRCTEAEARITAYTRELEKLATKKQGYEVSYTTTHCRMIDAFESE